MQSHFLVRKLHMPLYLLLVQPLFLFSLEPGEGEFTRSLNPEQSLCNVSNEFPVKCSVCLVNMKSWFPLLLTVHLVGAQCPYAQADLCSRLCVSQAWDYSNQPSCLASCPCSALQLSNNVCDSLCNTWECGFDQGQCSSCAPGCEVSSVGNSICDEECLVEECNYDSGDCATSDNPNVVYAAEGSGGGKGKLDDPYQGLKEALESLWMPANRVYLFPGDYELAGGEVLLSTPGLQYTEIRPLLCLTTPTVSCRVSLRFTAHLCTFSISHTVLISDLDIYGDFPLSCAECSFCPYLTDLSTHWVDDLGVPVNPADYADPSLCLPYHSQSLFTLTSTSHFTLTNVSFLRFQQQLSSLISLQCAELTLNNVHFLSSIVTTALIVFTNPTNSDFCGNIAIFDTKISYLNDGFAYRPDLSLGGAVFIQGIEGFYAENVTFYSNSIAYGNDGKSLIEIHNYREIYMRNVSFERSISTKSPLISLSTDLIYTSNETNLTHLELHSFNFTRNIGAGLISLEMTSEQQNVLINECFMEENMVVSGDLLAINGKNRGNEHFIRISNVRFFNNSVERLVTVSDVDNLTLVDVNITASGSSLGTSPRAYLAYVYAGLHGIGTVFDTGLVCKGLFTAENIGVVTVIESHWVGNQCEWPGLVFTGKSIATTIETAEFRDNIGAGLISQYSNSTTTLTHLTFLNNSNPNTLDPPCLNINPDSPASVSLSNAVFVNNTGNVATMALIQNSVSVSFRDVMVENHTAKYAGAGMIVGPLITGPSELRVSNGVFRECKSENYGVIALLDYLGVLSGNTVAIIRVIITNCSFVNIETVAQGAGITFNNYVQVTNDTQVSNCTFINCYSQRGGGLYLSYQTGVTNMTDCYFDYCGAPEGGAAIFAHQYPQTTLATYLILRNAVVKNSVRGSAVFISGYDGSIINVTASNNLFQSNTKSAYLISKGALVDHGSTYLNNTNLDGGAFYVKSSILTMTNIRAVGNFAPGFGGFILLNSAAQLSLTEAVLEQNSAGDMGGVIYADQSSVAVLRNVNAAGNTAKSRGAIAYFFTGRLTIVESKIVGNRAVQFGSLVLTQASVELIGTLMEGNEAGKQTPGLLLTDSSVTLSDCRFRSQIGDNGAFILSQSGSNVTATGCTFAQGTARSQGGAIFIGQRSRLEMASCQIVDCVAMTDGGGVMVSLSTLQVSNLMMSNLTAKAEGGAIRSEVSTVTIHSSTFTQISESAVSGENLLSLLITHTQFTNSTALYGPAIRLTNSTNVVVTSCLFQGLSATQGGAIYAVEEQNPQEIHHLDIQKSTFKDNTASIGGAVFIESLSVDLTDCVFDGNKATLIAGAVYLSSQYRALCTFTLRNNAFHGNSAEKKGGAIYWPNIQPDLQNCSFSSNAASYGANIASFPIQLRPLSVSGLPSNYSGTDVSGLPVGFRLDNVPSGQTYGSELHLGLYDHAGELVTYDSSSVVEMVPGNRSECGISGSTKAKATHGVYILKDFTATCQPGSEYPFTLTSSGISLLNYGNNSQVPIGTVAVLMYFRLCEAGETAINSACLLCPAETYSIDPELPCQVCPTTAICYGNITMVPRRGYWRPNTYTDQFLKCLREESCIGSPESGPLSLTGTCGEGYSGNLCQSCTWGYSHSQAYSCAKCPHTAANVVMCVFVTVILAMVVWGLVVSAITSATHYSALLSVYLRGLVSHFQMIAVAATIDFSWPYFAEVFMEQQSAIGSFSQQVFSYECVLAELKGGNEELFEVKLNILAVVPVLVMSVAGVVWIVVWLVRGTRDLVRKLQSTAVVLLFMLHPTLSRNNFSPFACMQLESTHYYMIPDMSIECWTPSHNRIIYGTALPCLIIWVIALPAFVFFLMLRKPGQCAVDIRFSFLAKGYTARFQTWELMILSRKVLMIAASVFLVSQSVAIVALSVLAVLLFALLAQIHFQPFLAAQLNRLETISLVITSLTVYFGMYYSSSEISAWAKVIFFAVLVVGNTVYLTFWGYAILPIVCNWIKTRFHREVHPEISHDQSSHETPRSSSRRILPIQEADKSEVAEAPPNSVEVSKDQYVTFHVQGK